MFDFLKKRKKEEQSQMTTLEQIKKAYADLSDDDKKTFEQSLKDRVDESVGEQEREDGNEDTQTAKDRVDEAEGEKRAEEREEAEEKTEEKTETHSDAELDRAQIEEMLKPLFARVEALEKKAAEASRETKEATDDEAKKLEALARRYTN